MSVFLCVHFDCITYVIMMMIKNFRVRHIYLNDTFCFFKGFHTSLQFLCTF